MVHRKLTRTADHQKSLLRNLVTNLLEYESITTTHAKAKEAQTAVERVITAAKNLRNRSVTTSKFDMLRRSQLLQNKFYKPKLLYPKLLNELTQRYADFNGGYTRILKLEPRLGDNAPQSILELIDGKRDMRFSITAKAVARAAALGEPMDSMTVRNMRKVTKTEDAKQRFEAEVAQMRKEYFADVKQGQNAIRELVRKTQRAPIRLVENPLTKNSCT